MSETSVAKAVRCERTIPAAYGTGADREVCGDRATAEAELVRGGRRVWKPVCAACAALFDETRPIHPSRLV